MGSLYTESTGVKGAASHKILPSELNREIRTDCHLLNSHYNA